MERLITMLSFKHGVVDTVLGDCFKGWSSECLIRVVEIESCRS